MSRLPRLTGRQLLKALVRQDFVVVRIKGSHHFIRHPDGRATVIPIHTNETLGPGLFIQILKDIEMSRDQLFQIL
jgi:predicted RNA binding protein YcfA (HicA-like mRNA interferase family)